MKFKVPIKKETNEKVSSYISKCNMWLIVFKQILRQNINRQKLEVRKDILFKLPCLKWTVNSADDINMITIINLYINRLYCYYDYYECQCYYKVSDLIKCPNTKNSLNKVIRIIEYGTLDIQPLFWLRKSYYSFIENMAIYIK